MAGAKRNAGGQALARLGKSGTEIGESLGRTKVTVSRWISGARIPEPDDRTQLQAKWGIDPSLWDMPPPTRAKASSAAAPPVPPSPIREVLDDAGIAAGALASLRAIQEQVDVEIALLRDEREEGSTPTERRRSLRELGKLALELAEGTGQLDLGRIMMRLPIWKRAMAELKETLKPYPEAAKAVVDRFEALDRAWSDGR